MPEVSRVISVDTDRAPRRRLKAGAPIKLSAFELGAVLVAPDRKVPSNSSAIRTDEAGEFKDIRQKLRVLSLFLVHCLSPSVAEGQLYDVAIYLVTG